jgi:peptide subunit release factor 1 (eRF1)
MSGFSSGCTCPNCGEEADIYQDTKPFDYVNIQCLHCGLQISPEITYLTLEELNSNREDLDLELLEVLPTQEKDLW